MPSGEHMPRYDGKSAKGRIEPCSNGTYRVHIKLSGEACTGPFRSKRSSAEADLAQVRGCIDYVEKRALLKAEGTTPQDGGERILRKVRGAW